MHDLAQSLRDANTASVEFLKVEAETGLTFAAIAKQSGDAGNAEKAARNRAQARIAYDTVLRFIGRVALTQAESESLDLQMTRLKIGLQKLGEPI